jgi:hypothetical protein
MRLTRAMCFTAHLQQFTVIRRARWVDVPSNRLNAHLAAMLGDMQTSLYFRLRHLKPCTLSNLECKVQLYGNNQASCACDVCAVE